MSARSIGSATISFGLVSIPVKLYSAGQTSESISFRMLHKKCGTPIKQQYVCPKEGEVVDRDDIVKGYEFAKDQYVLFTPDELKALEEEPTKLIAIREFVPIEKVDPVYFDKAYYLAPDKGGERAYRLLAEAMKKSGVVGLGQYASRGKQYLVALRPMDGGFVMQQLRYAEEVRPISEVPIPTQVDVKPAELKLAEQLIDQSRNESFAPNAYQDDVRKRVLDNIQRKVEGQEITVDTAEAPQAQIIDLMEALKASLGMGEAASKPKAQKPAAGERKPAKASPRKPAKDEGEAGASRSRKRSSK